MDNQFQTFFDTEQFIFEVKERRCLWDTSTKEYLNRDKKLLAWTDITRIVLVDFEEMNDAQKEIAVASVRKKWKNLRDCYAREERRKRSTRGNRGKTYAFYDLMLFLKTGGSNNTEIDSGGESEEETKRKQADKKTSYKEYEELRSQHRAEFEDRQRRLKAELEKNSDARIILLPRRFNSKPKTAKINNTTASDQNLSIEACYSIPNMPSNQDPEIAEINQSLRNFISSTCGENVSNPEYASGLTQNTLTHSTIPGIETIGEPMFQENVPSYDITIETASDTEIEDESNEQSLHELPRTASNIAWDNESDETRNQQLNTLTTPPNESSSFSELTDHRTVNHCMGVKGESRKRENSEQECNKLCQALQNALTANAAVKRTDVDSDELFFRYLLLEFKMIPNSRKADAKCSLIKLIEECKTKSKS